MFMGAISFSLSGEEIRRVPLHEARGLAMCLVRAHQRQ
jgi:hypothetical protein